MTEHQFDVAHIGPWRIWWMLGGTFAVQHLAMEFEVMRFTVDPEPADQVTAGYAANRWWQTGGADLARAARAAKTAVKS